jgi:putative ABC transport system permease protein
MFRNYLLVALRGLRKNKLYTSINIVGLTAGIVSCLLIGLYVWNELSYDRFNKKADRIVRMVMEYADGGTVNKTAVCGTKAGPQLSRTFPAIAAFTRTIKAGGVVRYQDKVFDEPGLLYADSSFFSIFSFPLLEGDPRTALNAPERVVLTRKLARKYFGDEDPVGKVVNIGRLGDCLVTGVAADPPGNSQVQFDLVASFVSLPVSKTEDWWTANYPTYLLLHEPSQLADLRQDISRYMKGVSRSLHMEGNDYLTYQLEPLLDVHLHSSVGGGLEPGGNIIYVLVLGTIALMILLIACVNYTNLATAQSAGRGPEVAVRKVLGARAGQLFGQFMGESVTLTSVSLILAIVITELSLPAFSSLTGKTFTPGMLLNPVPVTGVILLGILISFLAGGYPAFVLSNSAVIRMLKSGFRVTSAGNNIRKSLIVLQFVISVFLIISTIIVFQQLSYIRGKDLGYDKDHVLLLPVDAKMHQHYTALKDALRLNPDILGVSGGYEAPTHIEWADGISGDNGHGKINLSVSAAPVDLDFIPTMGMTLLAGRDFINSDFGRMDTTDNYANYQNSFIVNEQVVKEFGWTPEQAIGKTITKGSPGRIVGVVKDFHFASLHEPIGKMVIFLDTGEIRTLFVKISGNNIPGTLAYIQQVWKDRVSHRPFEYNFLDETYAAMYITEQRAGQVFGLFAGLAILLACLGLFALAAYTTVQRAKEIGIRKVLGATLSDITLLVSADFIRLVLISIVIASPIAWYLAHRWLADFAYRITLSWWVFALAGCVSVAIAFITVGYQALRAAAANPVKSLRTE